MKILNATLVVGGLFCVGCGGGSGNGTKDSAAAVVSGTIGPNTVGASYTGSEFFFTAEGTDITMARQGSHDAGAFEHYHAETPESRAYGAQSANSLVAVVASDSSTLVPYAGTNFQNLASTTIPTKFKHFASYKRARCHHSELYQRPRRRDYYGSRSPINRDQCFG